MKVKRRAQIPQIPWLDYKKYNKKLYYIIKHWKPGVRNTTNSALLNMSNLPFCVFCFSKLVILKIFLCYLYLKS